MLEIQVDIALLSLKYSNQASRLETQAEFLCSATSMLWS